MIEYNKANARIWSLLGSRRALGVVMAELANEDERFVLLTADVGRYYALNRLIEEHPEKLVNVGIAEQNMIGMATAMAKEGWNPFAVTYATFVTARVLDQIRVGLGLMRLPVRLIGVSAGMAEGDMSATHMGLEDVADIRAIPGIIILGPADCTETMKALQAAAKCDGPVYIRLSGSANDPIVFREDYDFQVGKAIRLREGSDVAIVATGAPVARSLKAAKLLEEQGVSCTVVDMHTIRPLDEEMLDQLAGAHKYIVTVEEHSTRGGLGSAVAEYYAPQRKHIPHLILGVDEYMDAAPYDVLIKRSGLDAEGIFTSALAFTKEM